jgi:hypothetical protein
VVLGAGWNTTIESFDPCSTLLRSCWKHPGPRCRALQRAHSSTNASASCESDSGPSSTWGSTQHCADLLATNLPPTSRRPTDLTDRLRRAHEPGGRRPTYHTLPLALQLWRGDTFRIALGARSSRVHSANVVGGLGRCLVCANSRPNSAPFRRPLLNIIESKFYKPGDTSETLYDCLLRCGLPERSAT